MALTLDDLRRFEGLPFDLAPNWIEVSMLFPRNRDVVTVECQGECNKHALPLSWDTAKETLAFPKFSLVDLKCYQFHEMKRSSAGRQYDLPLFFYLWIGRCGQCGAVHWLQ